MDNLKTKYVIGHCKYPFLKALSLTNTNIELTRGKRNPKHSQRQGNPRDEPPSPVLTPSVSSKTSVNSTTVQQKQFFKNRFLKRGGENQKKQEETLRELTFASEKGSSFSHST